MLHYRRSDAVTPRPARVDPHYVVPAASYPRIESYPLGCQPSRLAASPSDLAASLSSLAVSYDSDREVDADASLAPAQLLALGPSTADAVLAADVFLEELRLPSTATASASAVSGADEGNRYANELRVGLYAAGSSEASSRRSLPTDFQSATIWGSNISQRSIQ